MNPSKQVKTPVADLLDASPDAKEFIKADDYAAMRTALGVEHAWRNSKIACLGTSITAGEEWTSRLETLLNATLVNQGVSGGSLSSSASGSGVQIGAIYSQVSLISTDAELVLVECGINDFRGNATLGTIADTTTATFYGAVNKTIQDVLASYRERSLVFILPYGNTDTNFTGTWNTDNDNGDSLVDFRNAIIECCQKAGIAYIDIALSGIGGRTASTYMGDGIHLNSRGGERYANFVFESLRSIPKTAIETPTTGWIFRTATQSDVSAVNTTATYSSGSGGSVTNTGATINNYAVVWLATGSNNAAEFTCTGSFWLFFGQGSSGVAGIGDGTSGNFTVSGTITDGLVTTSGITSIPCSASATKYRAARIGNLLYLDAYVSGAWTTIINGVAISTYGTFTNYAETLKIGVLHLGTVTNYRTGTYSL